MNPLICKQKIISETNTLQGQYDNIILTMIGLEKKINKYKIMEKILSLYGAKLNAELKENNDDKNKENQQNVDKMKEEIITWFILQDW